MTTEKAAGNAASQDTEFGQNQFAGIARMHYRMMENALTFNAELLDFARRRIKSDIRANRKLAACKTVEEACEVMTGFYRDAIDNYTSEAQQLFEISQRMVEADLDKPSGR